MFGKKKISDEERLRAVYADESDNELLRLYSEVSKLTDAAREALSSELARRGLQTEATEATASGTPGETDGLPAMADDEITLYSFNDAFELREAIRVLEEESIPFRVLERSASMRRDGEPGEELWMDLVVLQMDARRAGQRLQETRQITAYAEGAAAGDLGLATPGELVLLLMCERAVALQAVQALSAAGISFYWRDGREDTEMADEETITLEVHVAQRERAGEALQTWWTNHADAETETA